MILREFRLEFSCFLQTIKLQKPFQKGSFLRRLGVFVRSCLIVYHIDNLNSYIMKKAKAHLKTTQTGRPAGSTIYNQEQFIRKAQAAYARSLKRGKQPSQEVIAEKLGISRATFCRYLQKYTSWSDIRRDVQ